jgi:hypothetical protein
VALLDQYFPGSNAQPLTDPSAMTPEMIAKMGLLARLLREPQAVGGYGAGTGATLAGVSPSSGDPLNGDQSGSAPLPPQEASINNPNMPLQTPTYDTGSYSPASAVGAASAVGDVGQPGKRLAGLRVRPGSVIDNIMDSVGGGANGTAAAAPAPAASATTSPISPAGMGFAGLLNEPKNGGFDIPPSTNDVQSHQPPVFKDGVPLPRPRPDAGLNGRDEQPAGAPLSLAPPNPSDSAALPPGATPAGPAAPSTGPSGGASPIGDGLKSVLGNLFDPNHAATWMALASGFAGAPNIGQGISRASAAAVPAIAADRANALKMSGITQTYQAVRSQLIAQGMDPAKAGMQAIAMAQNPELLKLAGPKIFGTLPPTVHMVTDAFGGQTPAIFDPNKGSFVDEKGQPTTGSATPVGGAGYLAKGVQAEDQTLGGKEYLDQYSPEVQASVQNYIDGKSMPTGNARKGWTMKIKSIAQKYSQDMGDPVDDNTFAARRTMRTQLSSGTPGSVGGQRNAGQVMLGHLDTVANAAEAMGNWNPSVFPDLAHWINGAMQSGSTSQAAKANGLNDAVQRYVAEVEKYYAGGVGAQSARDDAEKRFSSVKTPAELAAAIQAERSLGQSKLNVIDGQIRTTLGEKGAAQYPSITPEVQQHMKNIDATVARMQGRGSAAPAAPAAPRAAPPPGNYVYRGPGQPLVPAPAQ